MPRHQGVCVDCVWLQREALRRGLSDQLIAALTGLSKSTVGRAMRGEPVSVMTLVVLTDLLDEVKPSPTLTAIIPVPRSRARA